MGTGLAIGLGAATFGVQTISGIAAARQQSEQIRNQQRAAAQSTAINIRGVRTRAARTQQQIFRRTQDVAGAARARGAEAGIGTTGGTFAAIMRDIQIQAKQNFDVVEGDAQLRIQAIIAGQPRFAQPNTALQIASSIVGGLGTGLGIATNVSKIGTLLQGAPQAAQSTLSTAQVNAITSAPGLSSFNPNLTFSPTAVTPIAGTLGSFNTNLGF